MEIQKSSLANQAVLRLWEKLGHGKKPPLSTTAVAVCDVVETRLESLEKRLAALENPAASAKMPDTSGSRYDPE